MARLHIRGPLLTQSGYGVHSRQIFKWAQSRGHHVTTDVTRWGMTPWYLDESACNGLIGQIMRTTSEPKVRPDVSLQVILPNEWDASVCPKNVGVTAGVETNLCSPAWIDACTKMDAVVFPSRFAANTFINCGYEQAQVISETYYPACVEPAITLEKVENVKTKKNFLMLGQITGQDSTLDRKNTFNTIKWFFEEFANQDVGLFIKTNTGTNCKIDKRVTRNSIANVVNQIRPANCRAKIYLLHGVMSELEIASLYKSPKIIGLLSATRGEGFGLPLLEASVCGLPVIATNWSGHKDFLDKGEWLSVQKRLVPVPQAKIDGNIFVPGAHWADPDEKDFKKKMRALHKNTDFYRQKAEFLSTEIQKTFNFETICKQYDKLLENL